VRCPKDRGVQTVVLLFGNISSSIASEFNPRMNINGNKKEPHASEAL
jgi:hypothetical protein